MGDTPWAIRDRALAAVAYSTMFDRTELVELRRQDYDREPHQDVGRMLVRKTETREPMQREYQPVIPEAVYFLEAWLRASNITDGPLFRGIMPDGRVRKTALSAGQVAHAFKGIARTAGIADISRISGHSMRIGALHDLKHFGGNLLDIMQAGRWKSPVMPGRYLDRLDSESEEDPMLRMARAR
jgi:site-specific recombinase XerD